MIIEKGRQPLTPQLKTELTEAAVQAVMQRTAPCNVKDWASWQQIGCQLVRNAPEDSNDKDAHDFLSNLHRRVFEARTAYAEEGAWALCSVADAIVALKDERWPKYGKPEAFEMDCAYKGWRFELWGTTLYAYQNGVEVPCRFDLTQLEASGILTELVHMYYASDKNGIMPLLDGYIEQCSTGLS